MRSSKTSLPLEDSWGIVNTSDSANSDQETAYEVDQFDKRMKAQQRNTTSQRAAQKTEFIMPSLGNNAMDGSRLQDSQQSASARSAHSPTGFRRRSPRTSPTGESPRRRPPRTTESQSSSRYEDARPRNARSPPSGFPTSASASAGAAFSFVFEIVLGAFQLLKYPIMFGLAMWMLIGLMMLAQNFFMYSVEMALSPVCRIPVLSMLNPYCPTLYSEARDGAPVAFDEAVAAQSHFETLMEEATTPGILQLPREMKKGERVIRDLLQLVVHSEMDSKNELTLELERYIQSSIYTTEGFTKFNSHVGRAVDNVLVMSKYTLRVLDGFQIEQQSHGAVTRFWDGILTPFQPVRFSEDQISDQFIAYTKTMEAEILKLLNEAEDLQMQLNLMESCTDTIGGIAGRDEKHAVAKKDEVLSWLWTRVGGNRGKVGKLNREINFLRQVIEDRIAASKHIDKVILHLFGMKSQLENLRSELATPDLLRETKPLSVHIETILAAAERLEDKRQDSRDRELAYIRSPKDKEAKPLLELGSSRTR